YAVLILSRQWQAGSRAPLMKRLMLPSLVFIVVTTVYLLLPGSSFLGGVVALKQRLFYMPLAIAGFLFVRSEDDLKRFLILLVVCAIGVSLFGIYLYYTGPEGLHRLGANYSAEIVTPDFRGAETGYWRVPGTFNSPGQYGGYLH